MNFVFLLTFYLLSACSASDKTINHDQVKPFAQPNPVTISEKASIKFKPQLKTPGGCVSFPAVNAAGEITGGLKGTKGTDGCTEAPLGSQVYGRSAWYQDKWAMMYSWYFPKNFQAGTPKKRHDWANVVLWIDNPDLEMPAILGVSLSQQTLDPLRLAFIPVAAKLEPYAKEVSIPRVGFAGTETHVTRMSRRDYEYSYTGGSNTTVRVAHVYPTKFDWIGLTFATSDGQFQDLIMWEQLTEEARTALNTADFGDTKVPFNEDNFDAALKEAWPF